MPNNQFRSAGIETYVTAQLKYVGQILAITAFSCRSI